VSTSLAVISSSVFSPADVPGVIVTVMLFPSGPTLAALKPIAGEGGSTGGGVRSPDAASPFTSASSAVVSAASNTDVQAEPSFTVEPSNWNADSGTNRCAPVESVNVIGRLPVTSSAAGAIVESSSWSAEAMLIAPHHRSVTRASRRRRRGAGSSLTATRRSSCAR
jgi:hypothetical protein